MEGPTWSYKGMAMAAPMVRVSTLPFRLMCAHYGSDVTFTEELVAAKLAKCVREVRPAPAALPADSPLASVVPSWVAPQGPCYPGSMRVVEYVFYEAWKNGTKRTVVWSTFLPDGRDAAAGGHLEGKPLILQMGVSDPEVGARAAALVAADVDGLDVNMGCPKGFSVNQGMGAALMKDAPRAAAILTSIRAAIGPTKPLSFKTRVFDDTAASVAQVTTAAASAGIHTVTFHARLREQRSETPPMLSHTAAVVAAVREALPEPKPALVLNGSFGCSGWWHRSAANVITTPDAGPSPPPEDTATWGGRTAMLAAAAQFGCDGALVARDAMWNPTVFAPGSADGGGGPQYNADYLAVHRELLAGQAFHGTGWAFLKYHLTRTFQEAPQHRPLHRDLLAAKTFKEAAVLLGFDEATAAALAALHEERAAVEFVPGPAKVKAPKGTTDKRPRDEKE